MPTPPSFQEGDSEKVETTVGHMRQALWFRNFSIVTWEQLQTCEQALSDQADRAVEINEQNQTLKNDLVRVEVSRNRLRTATISLSVGLSLLLTGGILYAVISN